MQAGGWKTESIARYFVEPSSKKKRVRTYNAANDDPWSSASKPILSRVFVVSGGFKHA